MLPRKEQLLTDARCHGHVSRAAPRSRGGWQFAAGAFSLSVWAFMPKCPVCLAAYVALWTGLGLSLTAATYLRWSLLCISGMLLLYIAVRRKRRLLAGPGEHLAKG